MKITAFLLILVISAAGCGPSVPDREESYRAARATFAAQSRQSLGFLPAERLAGLATNPFSGFCFLLDKSLPPESSSPSSTPERGTGELAAFEFPRDTDKFMALRGELGRSDRSLILKAGTGVFLINREPLNIPRDELSEIEIRLRLERNHSFRVGLASRDITEWDDRQMGQVNITTDPGPEFQVYRISVGNLLKQRSFQVNLPPGANLRRFLLTAGEWPRGEIEIASIRFLKADARYRRNLYGAGSITLGGVTREGFWMPVPGRMSWEIALPAAPTFLEASVGLFGESQAGVEYEMRLKESGVVLARSVLEDHCAWNNLKAIDLGAWSSQSVTLTIETRGDEPNTVFWGDPAIRELPRKRFNVLIILEDALRADQLGCYGHPGAGTPATDRLAGDGIIFETAVSQAPMTRPSCPSLLTSLYPSATGVWSFEDTLEESFLTLPEILRRQGFVTAAFVQNPAGGIAAGLQQGFGEFYGRDIAGSWPVDLLPKAVGVWLERNERHNFFLYLHLLKPHGPYQPPPPFDQEFRKFSGEGEPVEARPGLEPPSIEHPTREGRVLRYQGEIAANDYYLGLLFELLEKQGLRDDTLVVIIADHGEFLGEEGHWGHSPPGLLPVLHIPLILSYPRMWPAGKRLAAPVQLLDVMPTVLALAGVAPEGLLLQGKSLLPLINDPADRSWQFRPIFSEEVTRLRGEAEKRGLGSVFWGGKHFLFSNALGEEDDRTRRTRILFLDGAGENLSAAGEEELAAAHKLLLDLQETSAAIKRNIQGGGEKVRRHDPELNKQLRALGYLQ